MIFYIVPGVVIVVCLIVMVVMIVRKLPQLTTINTETIPQEKEKLVKNRILLERLQRRFLATKSSIQQALKPLTNGLGVWWNELYQKTLELERETLKKSQPLKKIDLKQKIYDSLQQIEQAFAEQEYDKAEELAIDILKVDPKNLAACEWLGDIYLATKEYKQAREMYKVIIKRCTKRNGELQRDADKHQVANGFANLGYVYQMEGRNDFALLNYQKAVDLEPINPRFLDLLLKISIIVRDKNQAKIAFEAMKQADPDNQKLPELAEEIAALPDEVPQGS